VVVLKDWTVDEIVPGIPKQSLDPEAGTRNDTQKENARIPPHPRIVDAIVKPKLPVSVRVVIVIFRNRRNVGMMAKRISIDLETAVMWTNAVVGMKVTKYAVVMIVGLMSVGIGRITMVARDQVGIAMKRTITLPALQSIVIDIQNRKRNVVV
jgi:hypothetical protein